MKRPLPLPRLALILASFILKHKASTSRSIAGRLFMWAMAAAAFTFIIIAVIIKLSAKFSPDFAFFALGMISIFLWLIMWVKGKFQASRVKTDLTPTGLNDAALLNLIPEEISEDKNFKQLLVYIQDKPAESIIAGLIIGLIIGKQIKSFD